MGGLQKGVGALQQLGGSLVRQARLASQELVERGARLRSHVDKVAGAVAGSSMWHPEL